MKYGYARVSSTGQDLTIQIESLEKEGCDVIRHEKVSGTSTKGRNELNTLLEFLRDGDELVVVRIDRLARSIRDLQNIVHQLKEKSVVLSAIEQPVDTSTSAGKAFLDMLGVFAEFEREMLKERVLASHERARAEGKTIGRPSMINDALKTSIKFMREQGIGIKKIASELNVGVGTVYKAIEA